jgi:hypothetical protein
LRGDGVGLYALKEFLVLAMASIQKGIGIVQRFMSIIYNQLGVAAGRPVIASTHSTADVLLKCAHINLSLGQCEGGWSGFALYNKITENESICTLL